MAQANTSHPRPAAARRRTILLWTLAALITLTAAIYQRLIGPTRPVRGSVAVAGEELRYRLSRTHAGSDDHTVRIYAPGDQIGGTIFVRRYKTNDPWSSAPLLREGDDLTGALPNQPPGGKVSYYLVLEDLAREGSSHGTSDVRDARDVSDARITVPPGEPIVLRFRGSVPIGIIIPHVALIFLAMLWSNRAGLEGLARGGDPRRHTKWALILLVLGGLAFGPIMQWYAFGAFWTGFPLGHDLTDNKTLIAVIAWVLAFWLGRASIQRARAWAVIAALVTLVIFSIPHSVLGTELDYSSMAPSDSVHSEQVPSTSTE
jgi:hypothetical protein